MKVQNKIVVITGAGSGIGRATAELFARHGSKVIVSDFDEEKAEETTAKIQQSGGQAETIKADVSSFEDVKYLIAETVSRHGRLDVMVNNAGIGPSQMLRTSQHTLEDWQRVIAVNQTGVFYCMKLALLQMETQGNGNIVNVASLAGLKASGNNLSYSASKFAVVGMTKSAALEYANKNIRINAVCPGYTESPLLDEVLAQREDMNEILLRFIPMRRFGKVEEIAEAIAWLASDDTKFITGHALVLDGGTSI